MNSRHFPLHSSVMDSALGSMAFLNEIMARHPDAISFAPGAPNAIFVDEFDISAAIDTYIKHVTDQRGGDVQSARRLIFEYGPSKGIINELISQALSHDERLNIDPNAIVVTVGAQEAMLLVLRALIRGHRDRIAIASPCYVGLIGAARILDANIIAIPETEDGPDQDLLAAALIQSREDGAPVRALFVSPDYANPSGVMMTLKARYSLLELAKREGFLLVEDSTYAFAGEPAARLPSLKALDTGRHVIHIGTFSKTCMPGTRVGYVIADQILDGSSAETFILADALSRIKCMVSVNTSPISQAIVGGMLLRHGCSINSLGAQKAALYRASLAQLVEELAEALNPLVARHPAIRVSRPEAGFFVRLSLPLLVNYALLERSAVEFGVLWTPMSIFYLEVGRGQYEMRLSCSYLSPESITEGVRRLTLFLNTVCAESDSRNTHRNAETP